MGDSAAGFGFTHNTSLTKHFEVSVSSGLSTMSKEGDFVLPSVSLPASALVSGFVQPSTTERGGEFVYSTPAREKGDVIVTKVSRSERMRTARSVFNQHLHARGQKTTAEALAELGPVSGSLRAIAHEIAGVWSGKRSKLSI